MIVPRARDLGRFEVRRALPSARRQMMGPLTNLDQTGRSAFLLGEGLDVRRQPHIGLATVTYLVRGEIMHRDSLGTALPIRPGAVKGMTAGRGIVRSERSTPGARAAGSTPFGIQAGVALPAAQEETAPDFSHHEAAELPLVEDHGTRVRPGDGPTPYAATRARVLPAGGQPMDGPRHICWNVISSREDRIEQAMVDWPARRFAAVPGDPERIAVPGA